MRLIPTYVYGAFRLSSILPPARSRVCNLVRVLLRLIITIEVQGRLESSLELGMNEPDKIDGVVF